MPNHDGTGPNGSGRPGKGLGPCGRTDRALNNAMRRGFRRGLRQGFGGFGRRGWMCNDEMLDDESAYSYDKEALQKDKSRLEKLINWVNDRLADIEK